MQLVLLEPVVLTSIDVSELLHVNLIDSAVCSRSRGDATGNSAMVLQAVLAQAGTCGCMSRRAVVHEVKSDGVLHTYQSLAG